MLSMIQSIQERLASVVPSGNPFFQHAIILWAVALSDREQSSPLNSCELARRYTIGSSATVSRYLSDLNILIEFKYDTSDRRIKWLSLTQEGRDFLAAVTRDCHRLFDWNVDYTPANDCDIAYDIYWVRSMRLKEISLSRKFSTAI